jgi:hypothetical protein
MEFKLDHFRLYDVQPYFSGATLILQGQFDEIERPAVIGQLRQFANPVSKDGEAIKDKNSHLTLYDAATTFPDPPRSVRVQNQFGDQDLLIDHLLFLLVPAQKIEPGLDFPETLDHFKGYRVINGRAINKLVSLEDQFGAEDGVLVMEPLVFCVPSLKKYGGRVEEIKNPDDHLTIYRIAGNDYHTGRDVQDQFFPKPIQLAIFRSPALAVPSLKLEWSLAKL